MAIDKIGEKIEDIKVKDGVRSDISFIYRRWNKRLYR